MLSTQNMGGVVVKPKALRDMQAGAYILHARNASLTTGWWWPTTTAFRQSYAAAGAWSAWTMVRPGRTKSTISATAMLPAMLVSSP